MVIFLSFAKILGWGQKIGSGSKNGHPRVGWPVRVQNPENGHPGRSGVKPQKKWSRSGSGKSFFCLQFVDNSVFFTFSGPTPKNRCEICSTFSKIPKLGGRKILLGHSNLFRILTGFCVSLSPEVGQQRPNKLLIKAPHFLGSKRINYPFKVPSQAIWTIILGFDRSGGQRGLGGCFSALEAVFPKTGVVDHFIGS
jgi:hypothetical protein